MGPVPSLPPSRGEDFQRRSHKGYSKSSGRRHDHQDWRSWDSTPQSERGSRRGDSQSTRVPNVGWESTPRTPLNGGSSGWGGARNRTWDAPTPRVPRGRSPEDGLLGVDIREWEEEQLRLDRDWYSGAEEGFVAGDEERNPLAQYEGFNPLKPDFKPKPIVRVDVIHIISHISELACAETDICQTGPVCSSFLF